MPMSSHLLLAEIPFTVRLDDEWTSAQINRMIEHYGITRGFPTKKVPTIPE